MNMKRSSYRRNMDSEEQPSNTGGTNTRRQARFSFYPIFSAISGGITHSSSGSNNNTISNSNGKGNVSKSRETEDLADSNPPQITESLSGGKTTRTSHHEDVLNLSPSSQPPPCPSAFHISNFEEDEEEDSDKIIMAPIPFNTSNLGWNMDELDRPELNESSSLLSLSHHSLKSGSATSSRSAQSEEESMTGLEQAGLEMEETITRLQSLFSTQTQRQVSSIPTNDVVSERIITQDQQQNIIPNMDRKDRVDPSIILFEALQYLQQRRLQREQSLRTDHIKVPEESQPETKNRSSNHPKINTSIAPLPLYPSIKASQTKLKSESDLEPKSASTPPPIVPASKFDDRLLSPFVDVRHTVTSSIPVMFRNSHIPDASGIQSSLESQGYKDEEEMNEMDVSYFRHLHLAHSIHSSHPLLSSIPSSPRSNEVENGMLLEDEATNSLFPITPTRTTLTNNSVVQPESELKSPKTGWVQFSNENTLNPFSEPVQLSPWKYANKTSSDKSILEEKIEQCLESILISILERSSSTPPVSKETSQDSTSKSMGDIIEKSVSALVQEYSTLDLFENNKKELISAASPEIISSPQVSTKSDDQMTGATKNATVERLENENNGKTSRLADYDIDLLPDHVAQDDTSRCDDISDSNAIFDRDVSIESDDSTSDERNYSYDDHALDERDVHRYSNKVLGRLSAKMGGTTGVVLHNEDILDEYDGDDLDSQLNGIENSVEVIREKDGVDSVEDYLRNSIELGKESPDLSSDGIYSDKVHNPDRTERIFLPDTIETLSTGMCKNPTAIMSAFSFESFKNSSVRKDRKGIDGPLSLSFDDKDDVPDSSLVRRLYGHLLPELIKNDKRKSGLSSWLGAKFGDTTYYSKLWDESDPDETGFIKHKISQSQLQYLEAEYERLLQGYQSSPDSCRKRSSLSQMSAAAEDAALAALVVEEEDDTSKDMTDPKRSSEDIEIATSMLCEGDDSPVEKPRPMHTLQTNPAFPSAKAAGSGNVGDLEIYHLPIIYKAHQTGFEPTKDLVLQQGTIFAGQYYVQSELGGAAFSMTYRCIDLNSGKKGDDGEEYYEEVCLKVIKNNKDFFDQSLDEIKILELLRQTGKCNEHNIVEMKCFFYHKEHLVIVTELLRQNLFEFGKYIAENNEPQYFTRTRLCYIARQCLVSLNFIHKLGLVHSDIKPENILLSSYSKARVKVIDFGSSCYLTDRQSSYIQSRSYRAPEVVLGLPYDGKIDIWSLGCVIAEMYTGQVTFQNESVVSMLSRIESICGTFPRHMIENGRVSNQFFTANGLLFEKINNEQDSVDDVSVDMDEIFVNVFQPKVTTISSRLGLEAGLLERRRTKWEDEEKALFVDFIRKLLTVDPEHRPTAAQALEHPWILSGFNISDDDLMYPPTR